MSVVFELVTHSKGFNARANICQRNIFKEEFHTQTSILLKPSLLHLHLTDEMLI